MLATLLCSVLLARILGVDEFGIYSYVIALVTILALPAQAGIPTLLLRETAKAKATSDWSRMKGVWLWALYAVSLIGVLIIVIAALLRGVISFDLAELNNTNIIMLGIIMSLLVAIGNVRGAALRGLGLVIQGQLPEEIIRPVSLLMLLIVGAGLSFDINSSFAMGLHVIAALLAFAFGAWLLLNAKPLELRNKKPEIHWRAWCVSSMPLALMTGIQTVNGHVDLLMLGAIGTISEVGVYKVVVSGAALTVFGLQVASVVISPRLASSFARNNLEDVQKIASFGSLISFLFTIPILVLFSIFGMQLLDMVFGSEYSVGYTALLIITASQAISAFFGSSISIMTMSGNERHVLLAMTIAALVNVVLNLILIPSFGIEGAAIATATSIIIWNAYLWAVAKKKLGVDSTFLWIILNRSK